MKDFQGVIQPKMSIVIGVIRHYQLAIACVVIILCFAIGNDLYRAQAVTYKNRDLLNSRKRLVNYEDAVKAQAFKATYKTDLKQRYLIDPKAREQKTLLRALVGGADLCPSLNAAQPSPLITTLPYSDTGTTSGMADNYDLSGDPTGCPAPTCQANSGSFLDRGIAYMGTGTGPDVAYRISFTAAANMVITLDPTDTAPNADDLALVFYGGVCSNNPSDAIVIADNSGSGNPPDLVDNSETITITNIPAGNYNIVVDGYSYAGQSPASAGPYSLNVTCVTGMTCVQPKPARVRRGGT